VRIAAAFWQAAYASCGKISSLNGQVQSKLFCERFVLARGDRSAHSCLTPSRAACFAMRVRASGEALADEQIRRLMLKTVLGADCATANGHSATIWTESANRVKDCLISKINCRNWGRGKWISE
jgi:hypothetical protein